MKKIILIIFQCIFWVASLLGQEDTIYTSTVDKYSLEELLNLTVYTAEKNYQKIEKVPASVVVMTRRDIEIYGYTSLDEILTHVTGFYKINDHYWLGSTSYGVRGYFKTGPFSNVAVLVNGVSQLSDKYADYPDVKITVPVEAIDRIEIIRGPMAVIYGNGAFFGAINIITSGQETNPFKKQHFSVSAGNKGTLKSALQLTGKTDDLDYSFVFSANMSQGPDFKYTDLTSDTNFLEYVGLQPEATTKNQLGLSQIYAGINLGFKSIRFDMSYNESIKGVYDGSPALNEGNRLTTNAINVNLSYSKNLHEKLTLKGFAGFYHHTHFLNYELFRPYYYEIDFQKTNSFEAEASLIYKPSKKIKLFAGINQRTVLNLIQISDFGYYGLDYGAGEAGLPYNKTFSTRGIFMQATYNASEKLSFVMGARLEYLENYPMYYSRGIVSEDSSDLRPPNAENRFIIEETYRPENHGITLVPRVAVLYQLDQNQVIKLMYGEAQKHPSFTENYRQLPQELPHLYASIIKTLELNYSVNWSFFNINTSIFYNQLNKIISATNSFNPVTGEWNIFGANSGKLNTLGSELQILWKPIKQVNLEVSGIYQKTTDLRPGYENINVAYSPEFLGYCKFYYLAPRNYTVGITARYVGSMKTEWITDSLPEAGHRLAQDTEPYLIWDLNARKDNLIKKGFYVNIKIYEYRINILIPSFSNRS